MNTIEKIKQNLTLSINETKQRKGSVYIANQQKLFMEIGDLDKAMEIMKSIANEINFGDWTFKLTYFKY